MAKKAYIGVQTSHTYTNMLGGIGDMETGAVYKTTAEAAYLKNSSQHKFGSGSQAFQQSDSATELTYTLRNSAGQMSFALDNTHTYYFSVWINQRTSLNITFDCYWPIAEPPIMSGVKNTALNTWEQHSAVFTRSGFTSGTYPMRIDCNNYPGNNALMNVDGMMLVDLTATYGAGNEPTKEFCDQYFAFTTGTNTVTIPTAREITKMYIGVDGKARKVKKAYVGVGGKARLFYTSTLPPTTIELWNGKYIYTGIADVCYANGYWAAVGNYNKGGGDSGLMLAYTDDLSKGFTSIELPYDYSAAGIVYADGYWAIACENNGYSYVLYATSLTGTWSSERLPYNTVNTPKGIYYANGYWVIYGYTGYQAMIAYSTSLSGSWSKRKLWEANSSDYDAAIRKIVYANGYWAAVGYSTASRTTYSILAYSTSLDGNWTENIIYTDSARSNQGGVYDIKFENNTWVCGAYGMILYANSLTGAWTSKSVLGSAAFHNAIIYANGYWVVVGGNGVNADYARIAYSTALDGTWTVLKKWDSDIVLESEVIDVVYGGEYYFFGVYVRYNDGTGALYSGRVAYAADPTDFAQL